MKRSRWRLVEVQRGRSSQGLREEGSSGTVVVCCDRDRWGQRGAGSREVEVGTGGRCGETVNRCADRGWYWKLSGDQKMGFCGRISRLMNVDLMVFTGALTNELAVMVF